MNTVGTHRLDIFKNNSELTDNFIGVMKTISALGYKIMNIRIDNSVLNIESLVNYQKLSYCR